MFHTDRRNTSEGFTVGQIWFYSKNQNGGTNRDRKLNAKSGQIRDTSSVQLPSKLESFLLLVVNCSRGLGARRMNMCF